MVSNYVLWVLEAGNLVVAFCSEAAAQAVVERALADQGPASVEALTLVYEDERGGLTTIAEGLDLVRGKGQP